MFVVDIAKGWLLAVPAIRRRRQPVRAGVYANQNTVEYVTGVYRELREHLEPYRPITGTLLEIGPGGNKAVAALFVANGLDSATCIDVVQWETAGQLYDELDVRHLLDRVGYIAPASIANVPLPDASFDFVVSHAAFEHFLEPEAACGEIARLLKPGGVTTHEIDFRNHRDFDQPLDHLRYPEWLWKPVIAGRPGATNRWRLSDLIDGFEQHGLEVVDVSVSKTTPIDAEYRSKLRPEFRVKDLEDLGVLEAFVTARRR